MSLSQGRNTEVLALLRSCGGYYQCPRANGSYIGDLVGFTGDYLASDGTSKKWVGDTYLNFARLERNALQFRAVCQKMAELVRSTLPTFSTLCGIPNGGISLAFGMSLILAEKANVSCIYPEKHTISLGVDGRRPTTVLRFDRHTPEPDERVVVVEDVVNNFTSAERQIQLIEKHGAKVVAIACAINRSPGIDDVFEFRREDGALHSIPVLQLARLRLPEFKQDDPRVAAMIAAGRIVWNPKASWKKLLDQMEAAKDRQSWLSKAAGESTQIDATQDD